MDCPVTDITGTLVAVTTSTSVQGEAYRYRPFSHGNFFAHAFVSVELCCVWFVVVVVGLAC